MSDHPVSIGVKIKHLREALGWNQKELADKASVSPSTISGTENERFLPSPDVLHRIAKTLKVPFHELVDLIPHLKVEAMLEIAQIYRRGIDLDRALAMIARIKQQEATLHDYQRDELTWVEGNVLIVKPDTRMQAVAMLYALANKLKDSAQFNPLFFAKVHNAIGNAWALNKDFVTAKHHYQRSIDILHSHPMVDDLIVPGLYYNMADCLRMMSQEKTAIEYLNKAIPLFQRHPVPYYLGSCYLNVGNCYQNLGDAQSAVPFFRKAIPYYAEAGAKRLEYATRSLAACLSDDPPEEIIAVLEEELRVMQDELQPHEIALIKARIANVYRNRGDYAVATHLFAEAVELSATGQVTEERGFVLLHYAKLLYAMGEYEAASTYAFESSDVYSSMRLLHTDLREALHIGQQALLRLRESCGQKKGS
ncbi:tetratricopeptide repeat protein [Tumebacillus permanentifrigoris]|uniref:DNA-binding XRE family transcriptional regulator n=1 Tax=Tumebacillus permanentifrigoris TaxID=378543 RepID=A0A316D5N9_9BACL|nr:tetratricopeptide repeat protein [Tumebacillus permanentifrigoris]PWK09580.1 DNA-binding XRE family transcriptional regulator [Tumebacillus permanentifrigoris]